MFFLKKISKAINLTKTWNPDVMLIGLKLLVNVSKDGLFAMARTSSKKNEAHYIVASDLGEINGTQYHAYSFSESDVAETETKTELTKLTFERATSHD